MPEIGRLRYVSSPGYLYLNEDSEIVTSILKTQHLPYINTSKPVKINGRADAKTIAQAGRVVYGSNQ